MIFLVEPATCDFYSLGCTVDCGSQCFGDCGSFSW